MFTAAAPEKININKYIQTQIKKCVQFLMSFLLKDTIQVGMNQRQNKEGKIACE